MWNSGVGIEGDSYSTISGCVAEMQNSGAAISAGWGSIVRDCIAGSQGTEAMLVGSFCQVLNNNCFGYGPGGAAPAIRVTGSRNRIEGNRVSSAQSGILVDGTSNLIIRNSATGNGTDYSIAAGNCTGSIVAGEAALNAASNPNVNISF
jgi:parallel beta-helix repeat protein